jgi:hypothetical protein
MHTLSAVIIHHKSTHKLKYDKHSDPQTKHGSTKEKMVRPTPMTTEEAKNWVILLHSDLPCSEFVAGALDIRQLVRRSGRTDSTQSHKCIAVTQSTTHV